MKIKYSRGMKLMHLFLQPKCDFVAICTDWNDGSCTWGATVHIMLKNGFVAFDSRSKFIGWGIITVIGKILLYRNFLREKTSFKASLF